MIKDLTKAKKYDCPVKFEVTNCEAGWVDMKCDFRGIVLTFAVSDIGDMPSTLIEVAYMLHSNYDNYVEVLRNIKVDDEVSDITDQFGSGGWDANLGATFCWDEEPRSNDWHVYYDKKDFGKEDYDLIIEIKRSIGCYEEYRFVVTYRDFCYAIAKCFTDVIKKYGFSGYDTRSYQDYVIVRHLLIVKAYALGLLGTWIGWRDGNLDMDYFDLTFDQELELLRMDM